MTDDISAQNAEDPGKNDKTSSETEAAPPAAPAAAEELREPFPFSRMFLTIIFGVIAAGAYWILVILAMLQFLTIAIAGHKNDELQHFSRLMARYVQEIFDYMTLANDVRPFPLGPFPKE